MRVFKSTILKSELTSLVLGLAFTLGSVSASQAATFTVTSLADSGAGSLREAIDQANANPGADSIDFTVSGTITLSSTLPFVSFAGGPLAIDGTGQSVIISGNNSVRVMSVEDSNSSNPPSGAVLEVKNLTIANGRDTPNHGGGGILNIRGTLTVTNCVIRDNSASDGGGIYNFFGTVTINNSSFTGNSATHWGGGVVNDNSSTTITGSTFAGNTAGDSGGGVYGGNSPVNITNSILSGNHASHGGAIYSGYVVNVVNSTLSGNTADLGGAIYGSADEGGPFVSVRNSTLSGNTATTAGGALYLIVGLNAISNSTFSNNNAPSGGGLYGLHDPGTGGIINSTFFNSAIVNPFEGFGFPLRMGNTIVAGGSTCSGVTDGGYNIDTGSTCGFSGTSQSNFAGPLLDPQGLQDNGGQTQTIALLAGSTAVNAIPIGTNGCGAAGQTDQRGVLRPQGSGCDIGAFEVVTDSDADGVLDDADLCPGTLLADFADRPGRPMKNRFFAMGDGKFVDGNGTFSGFTLADTFGCSGKQIIQVVGIGDGHDKFGIPRGVILDWIAAHQ